MKMKWTLLDLHVVILLAHAAMTACLITGTMGAVLALPFVLVLPGYALTAAVLPPDALARAERLALSVGLSVALTIASGIALNLVPGGIRENSWALLLGGITLAASVVGLARAAGIPLATFRTWRTHLSIPQAFMCAGAAAMIVAAIIFSSASASGSQPSQMTQLWALPANSNQSADQHTIRVGVANLQTGSQTYRLDVLVAGAVVEEWQSLNLTSQQRWEASVALPLTGTPSVQQVEVDLYRADAPAQIYRHVSLWLLLPGEPAAPMAPAPTRGHYT